MNKTNFRVNEAMDMAEGFANEAAQMMEQARIVAAEARKIPDIPKSLDRRLIRLICLITDIERIDYGRSAIEKVRESLDD